MDLTAHLLDLEAIDGFVRDVAGEGGGAAHSLRLLQRQPELFAKGERILRKSIAPARAVTVDDLTLTLTLTLALTLTLTLALTLTGRLRAT